MAMRAGNGGGPVYDTNINHEDLNFGDIDILEDELRRSSHNNVGGNGMFIHNFN